MPELTHGPNPRLPSASVGLEICWTEDRGRCFTATRDLLPGTVQYSTVQNSVQYSTELQFSTILRSGVFRVKSEYKTRPKCPKIPKDYFFLVLMISI